MYSCVVRSRALSKRITKENPAWSKLLSKEQEACSRNDFEWSLVSKRVGAVIWSAVASKEKGACSSNDFKNADVWVFVIPCSQTLREASPSDDFERQVDSERALATIPNVPCEHTAPVSCFRMLSSGLELFQSALQTRC